MFTKRIIISSLLVMAAATSSTAEVLYTLVSPNEESGGQFGYSVSSAGDVNGDGYDDVVVGAAYEAPGSSPEEAGRAYLFDGLTGNLLHTLVSSYEEYHGRFGRRVSGAGDVNGDGYDDVVVGAYLENPGSSPNDAGRAYVFDGLTGNPLHTLVSPNEEEDGHFGFSVSGAGDVNEDRYDDVVVGASGEDPGSSPHHAGRAYVFDGQSGNLLHTLVSPNEEVVGYFGSPVSGAGDVNGDGYDDLVVGAHLEDPGSSPDNAGRAYVFDGQMGNPLFTLVSPNEESYGYFGFSVSGAGDMNGDGYADVVVGALWEDPGSSPDHAGRAYVFDGQSGNLLHTLVSPNEELGGSFGFSLSGAGDINRDGYDDLVVGAHLENPGSSPSRAGRAYVFDGLTGSPLHTLVSPNEEEHSDFGVSTSGAGDVNGDGYDDLVVGARGESPGSSLEYAGRAYIFSWMNLSSGFSGDVLELQWSLWPTATEYWIYGMTNEPWFLPDLSPPTYVNRVAVVPAGTTTWSSPNGIGDPEDNRAYLVIAVNNANQEIARSNRVGEYDFQGDIP